MRTWLAVVDTPSCTELPLNWPIWGELWSGPSLGVEIQRLWQMKGGEGKENRQNKERKKEKRKNNFYINSRLFSPAIKSLGSKSRSTHPSAVIWSLQSLKDFMKKCIQHYSRYWMIHADAGWKMLCKKMHTSSYCKYQLAVSKASFGQLYISRVWFSLLKWKYQSMLALKCWSI